MIHSSALRTVQDMGENHDLPVREWQDLIAASVSNAKSTSTESAEAEPVKGYILVGDNIDKRVNPREMHVENQVQSLHYFHTYAAQNRCDSLHLDDLPIGDIRDQPMSTFLLTPDECMMIRSNYVILVSRIIVENLPAFSAFMQHVPQHVPHKYSDVMSKQSQMVSEDRQHLYGQLSNSYTCGVPWYKRCTECVYLLCTLVQVPVGVITKNEVIREELVQIILELQEKYAPIQGKYHLCAG